MDEAGNSPFWDGLAGRFFDMSFPEADRVQRDPRHAVHRRSDAAHADLRGAARRSRAGGHRPAASERASARCKMLEEEGFAVRSLCRHLRRRPDRHRRAPTTSGRCANRAHATVAEIGRRRRTTDDPRHRHAARFRRLLRPASSAMPDGGHHRSTPRRAAMLGVEARRPDPVAAAR